MSTHTNSPDHTPIQPLHNPSLAAHVIVSHALNHKGSIPPFAKKGNRNDSGGRTDDPAINSPTDEIVTPCTQKLSAARKKRFNKPLKAVQLFSQTENSEASEEEEKVSDQVAVPTEKKMEDDNENPF